MNLNTQHKTLAQTGYDINYFVTGNPNNKAIICLHPAFADHNCFNLQITALAQQYFIIAIDMMGHGLSQPEKTKEGIIQTPQHIIQIMNKEGVDSTHLIGVSLGSLIAQYFAELYPEKTLSLCLLGSYGINRIDKEIMKAQRKEALKWIFKIICSMESFRRYVAKQSVYTAERQEGFHEMALKFRRSSLRYMRSLGSVIANRQSKCDHLAKLILVGEHDIDLAQRKSRELHESLTNSQFKIIPEAGHCANMDNPDAFNEILMNWLE